MLSSEDWLQDPLVKNRGYRKLKSSNAEQDDKQSNWKLFHYSTRLKLNGAKFFYAKVIDTAHTSEDELRWYLDAFFFELIAACDTLLQEVNTVYAYDLQLKPEAVRWNNKKKNKFMERLPEEIFNHIEAERRKDWFCEVQWHRNTTTHHYRTPLVILRSDGSIPPTQPIHVGLQDKEGKSREISICIQDYLSNMVNYISSVWGKMAQEFE